MRDYDFEIKELADNNFELILLNTWNKETLNKNIQALNKLNIKKNSKLIVNFQNLKECDNSAIIYLISYFKTFQEENITLENDSLRVLKIYKEIKDYKNLKNFNVLENDMMNFVSYNENPPINSFKKYKNPLLISYGTNDVRAFNNNLLPLLINKKNLELKIYPDLDHNFIKKEFDNEGNPLEDSYHWDRVFKDVVDWLLNE